MAKASTGQKLLWIDGNKEYQTKLTLTWSIANDKTYKRTNTPPAATTLNIWLPAKLQPPLSTWNLYILVHVLFFYK